MCFLPEMQGHRNHYPDVSKALFLFPCVLWPQPWEQALCSLSSSPSSSAFLFSFPAFHPSPCSDTLQPSISCPITPDPYSWGLQKPMGSLQPFLPERPSSKDAPLLSLISISRERHSRRFGIHSTSQLFCLLAALALGQLLLLLLSFISSCGYSRPSSWGMGSEIYTSGLQPFEELPVWASCVHPEWKGVGRKPRDSVLWSLPMPCMRCGS